MKASKKAQERAAKLRELVARHAHLYYTLDAPEISDSAYDALHRELVDLEKKYPELGDKRSVTRRIIGEALPVLRKVRHMVPQWSFNDAFTEKEVRAFDERIRRAMLGLTKSQGLRKSVHPTYDLELKIDGLKIVFTYEKGRLVLAATRGDGIVGEDVTHNVRTIPTVPERLSRAVDVVAEGEVYLTRSGFAKLNALRQARGASRSSRIRGTPPPAPFASLTRILRRSARSVHFSTTSRRLPKRFLRRRAKNLSI